MTSKTLSSPTVDQKFPEGTADTDYTFTVTGTLEDGSAFSQTDTDPTASKAFDLQPGTYTGVVSKLGVASQPSAPLVLTAGTEVTLTVPDPAGPAVFS